MKNQKKSFFNRPMLPNEFYPVPDLLKYTGLGVVRKFAKDSAVVLPGESTCRLIYVLSGKLRINMVTGNGRERLIYVAEKYTILGRLFESNVNDFYIIAESDTELCYFTKEQLKQIFLEDDEIIFEVLKNYTSKTAYFMSQIKYLHAYSPALRIYQLIWDLNCEKGKKVGDRYVIESSIAQKNISEITGVHYVTVSKVFGNLKKNGIARKTRNAIIIYDLERLKQLLEDDEYN